MRVWLTAFVVLFAAIELFEWVMQLSSWQPPGLWLILGGMGLAALSNVTHLPKVPPIKEIALAEDSAEGSTTGTHTKATGLNQPVAQIAATHQKTVDRKAAGESDKDTISFKIRPLKQ
ncbi:MAG: hypothetical protein AAFO84_05200 [Cyanobacteria bacterium J06598_1]